MNEEEKESKTIGVPPLLLVNVMLLSVLDLPLGLPL